MRILKEKKEAKQRERERLNELHVEEKRRQVGIVLFNIECRPKKKD